MTTRIASTDARAPQAVRPSARRLVAYVATTAVVLGAPVWAGAYGVSILTMVGFHAILALGLVLLTGLAGQVSLGQAMFYGMGAYLTAARKIEGHAGRPARTVSSAER